MGNTESQPALSETVVSTLPKRTQQRLSQVARHHQPSSFSFFEAAAVANTPGPKSTISPRKPNSEKTNSTKSMEKKSNSHVTTSSSIRESILSLSDGRQLQLFYSELGGRRYLTSPGTHYLLPVDDDEADRIVILHFLLKYAFKGNIIAPIVSKLKQSKAQVLDIGCGGGTWLLEMAADYPAAEFYGIDLLPIFPKDVKQNNAHFSQHNFLVSLPFPDSTLDFVHLRFMLALLTPNQLGTILREVSRVLKPLGTIEIVDVDLRIQRPGSLCQSILNEELHRAFSRHDIQLLQSHQLSTILMSPNYGFVEINQQQVTIPLGWGGQVGQVHAQTTESFLKSLSPSVRDSIVTPPPTWQPDAQGLSDTVIEQAMKECLRHQSYLNWFVCYAQKSLVPPNALSSKSSSIASTVSQPVILPEGNWETIDHFIDGFTD
ncbi:hypothetical protein BC941DRAFT_413450 [Chlamydoabsidia padenii]|nr:hypothetical protein BC941DRAFT_413450 [Chlamydoabsidia padenii]